MYTYNSNRVFFADFAPVSLVAMYTCSLSMASRIHYLKKLARAQVSEQNCFLPHWNRKDRWQPLGPWKNFRSRSRARVPVFIAGNPPRSKILFSKKPVLCAVLESALTALNGQFGHVAISHFTVLVHTRIWRARLTCWASAFNSHREACIFVFSFL